MELKEMMSYKNFVVVGNTIDDSKYAYKIKHELSNAGYQVACVGKELKSLNDVSFDIDIIDLCINPNVGIQLLKENQKTCKAVLIQPGAESEEIKAFLESQNIPYLEGCALVGVKLYA